MRRELAEGSHLHAALDVTRCSLCEVGVQPSLHPVEESNRRIVGGSEALTCPQNVAVHRQLAAWELSWASRYPADR